MLTVELSAFMSILFTTASGRKLDKIKYLPVILIIFPVLNYNNNQQPPKQIVNGWSQSFFTIWTMNEKKVKISNIFLPPSYQHYLYMMLTSFKEEFDEGFQRSDLLYNIVMDVLIFLFFLFFGFLVPLPLPIVFIIFCFFHFFSSNLVAPHVTLFSPL